MTQAILFDFDGTLVGISLFLPSFTLRKDRDYAARNTAQTELNDNNNFGKDFGKELTDRQRIILKMLAEDGSLSAKSLSEKMSEKNSGKKLTDRD